MIYEFHSTPFAVLAQCGVRWMRDASVFWFLDRKTLAKIEIYGN